MFRLLLALLLMSTPAWATQWRAGTGEQTILGSSNAADIDFNSYNSIVKPLDNLLSTYCNEYLTYASSTTLKVSSGSVVVSNSGGTIRLMLQDSAQTTLTSGNLDSGAFVANTTYYVYSTAATSSATASTYYISTSNTAPSGQTYYYQIGYFATDSSTQITDIHTNYANSQFGAWAAKSTGVTYQALTDGFVLVLAPTTGSFASGATGSVSIYTDSSSSPATLRQVIGTPSGTTALSTSAICPVKRGEYYKVTNSATGSWTEYFIPIGI